jgi:predicted CXXCH cytochrome family protein
MKVLFLFLIFFAFLASAPFSQASPQKPKKNAAAESVTGNYLGSDACIACHDDANNTLDKTAHRKLFAEKDAAKNGCEACHGPGSEHVNGNGDTAKIVRFAGASAREVTSRCGACHVDFEEGHGHKSVNCLSCHSVHHAPQTKAILLKPTPDLCASCHP